MGVGDDAAGGPEGGPHRAEEDVGKFAATRVLPADLPRLQDERVRRMEQLMRAAAAFARGESSR